MSNDKWFDIGVFMALMGVGIMATVFIINHLKR
jgi:hypothetical protein